jgi:predicted NBD/HSP70 family sugar kinase
LPGRPPGRDGGRVAVTRTTTAPQTAAARVADPGRRAATGGGVLRTVLESGPLARSTIARITGLSPASVTGHCADLVRLGLLCERAEQVRSNGAGRPHVPVDIDVAKHLVAAAHVSVPTTMTALLDLRGRVLARCVTPHVSTDPDAVLTAAAESIRALCRAYGGDARPLGIGVATGGWVDPVAGTVVEHIRLGWSGVPVRERLGDLTGLPVRVDGHSRALLHAEVLLGRARHVGSVLHVYAGNVVDAAFAFRGEPHPGSRAQAGAIAHLPVPGSREPCSCGRVGCLEATVSELTLARRAHDRGIVAAAEFPLLFEAARAGEPAAVALLDERARHLGAAVALLMDALAPELTIVTDSVLPFLPSALAALRESAARGTHTDIDVDSALISTGFPGAVQETAAGAVLLDALYRDPFGLAEPGINSEGCNVDTPVRPR